MSELGEEDAVGRVNMSLFGNARVTQVVGVGLGVCFWGRLLVWEVPLGWLRHPLWNWFFESGHV